MLPVFAAEVVELGTPARGCHSPQSGALGRCLPPPPPCRRKGGKGGGAGREGNGEHFDQNPMAVRVRHCKETQELQQGHPSQYHRNLIQLPLLLDIVPLFYMQLKWVKLCSADLVKAQGCPAMVVHRRALGLSLRGDGVPWLDPPPQKGSIDRSPQNQPTNIPGSNMGGGGGGGGIVPFQQHVVDMHTSWTVLRGCVAPQLSQMKVRPPPCVTYSPFVVFLQGPGQFILHRMMQSRSSSKAPPPPAWARACSSSACPLPFWSHTTIPCVLPHPSLVACTGTGRVSFFILTTVSEGPRGRTSAALGLSSADGLHERGAPPTRDLCR